MAAPTELLQALRSLIVEAARDSGGPSFLPPGASAAEFAAVRFGGPTRVSVRQVTAGVAASRLVGNNPRRLFWLAANNGTASGAVSFEPSVTVSTGIPVQGNGGTLSMGVEEDGEPVAWEWYVISSAAAQGWTVFEVERV